MENERNIDRRRFLSAGTVAGLGVAGLVAPRAALAAEGRLAGKKVLIATGEWGESLETYYMKYRLLEEGAVPSVASLSVKRIQLVVHDFEPGYDAYTEKLGYQLASDIAYKDVDPTQYDGLLIPGGRAPEEIRLNTDLVRIVRYFLDNNRLVGAMCHGVMLIYTARAIRGRRLAAYQGIRPDIELLGGEFVDREVVVDGSLVTSRGWPDLPAFMREFLKRLESTRS
jgi:protease I